MTKVLVAGESPEDPEQPQEDHGVAGSGPQSPLNLLRGRRKEALSTLFCDLAVPRWEEILGATLWVRYRPVNPALYSQTIQRMEKDFLAMEAKKKGSGDQEWTTRANADLLVKACVAIYDLPIGEDPPRGLPTSLDYPTFSSDELAQTLDILPGNAINTARALYLSDGDLLLTGQQLLDFSGEFSTKADSDFLGDSGATPS